MKNIENHFIQDNLDSVLKEQQMKSNKAVSGHSFVNISSVQEEEKHKDSSDLDHSLFSKFDYNRESGSSDSTPKAKMPKFKNKKPSQFNL